MTNLRKTAAWGRDELMVIAAFRYCLGRMTYIVGDCADWLIENWAAFDDETREIIKRDLEKEFARDDRDRTDGRARGFGMDMDRRQWERVRALWNDKP
jgi:hypothetical protein